MLTKAEDLHGRQVAQRNEIIQKPKQLAPDYFSTHRKPPRDTDAQVAAALQYYLWQWEKGSSKKPWLPDTSLQNTWTNIERLASVFRGVSSSTSWRPEDKLRSIVAQSKKELVGLCLECEREDQVKEIREDCGHAFRD